MLTPVRFGSTPNPPQVNRELAVQNFNWVQAALAQQFQDAERDGSNLGYELSPRSVESLAAAAQATGIRLNYNA